jgi:hypothetical protein
MDNSIFLSKSSQEMRVCCIYASINLTHYAQLNETQNLIFTQKYRFRKMVFLGFLRLSLLAIFRIWFIILPGILLSFHGV